MNRNLIIQIGEITVRDPMQIIAKVVKDGKSNQPDFAEVSIFNLSEGTRQDLAKPDQAIAIFGGHGDVEDLIFTGDVQAVSSAKAGTEWVTSIIAGDGATAMKQAIFNKSYDAPVKFIDLVNDLVTSSGLAETVENIGVNNFDVGGRASIYSGQASRYLSEIAEAHGYEWNIQDGDVSVNKLKKTRDKIYNISVETGMVGSPEWMNKGKDDDNTDSLRVKAANLCIPSIRPNDKARIWSRTLQAVMGGSLYKTTQASLNDDFNVRKVTHDLNSRSGPFYTIIEAETIS